MIGVETKRVAAAGDGVLHHAVELSDATMALILPAPLTDFRTTRHRHVQWANTAHSTMYAIRLGGAPSRFFMYDVR